MLQAPPRGGVAVYPRDSPEGSGASERPGNRGESSSPRHRRWSLKGFPKGYARWPRAHARPTPTSVSEWGR